eukprot:449636-Rhodomonas_salina.2
MPEEGGYAAYWRLELEYTRIPPPTSGLLAPGSTVAYVKTALCLAPAAVGYMSVPHAAYRMLQ